MAVPVEHSAEATSNPPAAKRRLRKWLIRIAIFVVGFILLVGIVIQAALLTGLPKAIVVGQVEKGLGLRMGVDRVSAGWFGRTSLYGVKIALPLSDQSFVEVPEMRVRHTSLIAMILGRSLVVKEVELDKPVVSVWQDASGRWNLLEVVELLSRVGGKKTGEQTADSDTPTLPQLWVNASWAFSVPSMLTAPFASDRRCRPWARLPLVVRPGLATLVVPRPERNATR